MDEKKRSKLVNEENENIRLTKNINHSKSFLFASLKLGNEGVFKVLTALERNVM